MAVLRASGCDGSYGTRAPGGRQISVVMAWLRPACVGGLWFFYTVGLSNVGEAMTAKIVRLPDDFIGKDDQSKLESFGAYLISHGWATRWHWNRQRGFDIAFEIYIGDAHRPPSFTIKRDHENDVFYAADARGKEIRRGSLDAIMTEIDSLAQSPPDNLPA